MSQPSPLQATRQRARALADSGDAAQARALLENAVELGRMNLGEDDPEVLSTAHQLAVVLHRAGDAPAARRVLEEAYAAGQWRLGETDALMLEISYELGVVAEEMENRHEARRAFGRVAAHGPAVLGPDHWAVTRARAYLGEDPATVRIELPDNHAQSPLFPSANPAPTPQPVTHFPPPVSTSLPVSAPPTSVPPYGYAVDAYGYSVQSAPGVPVQRSVSAVPVSGQIVSGVPAAAPAEPRGSSMRVPALFAGIAAVLGVIIAVIALVIGLAGKGDKSEKSNVPTLSGPAPTDVRMRDYGSSVKLFWTDPANGRTSFMITGGRAGEQLRVMSQVGPSTVTFDLNGLNPDLDYCFAIVAVYSTTQFSTSPQICTGRDRSGASPAPSKS
ncbi:hypothetical protein GCM10010435_82560 [Winogradskya consettensis]|uniref:Fibronectin type-III domain-containing protein n=1 Tax=Winogradskya consettensis TaxID=113560 RepID=A0A919SXC8_9ACTN|nr:tetratricopeptide repeat protein [Actinoplanes consettensis]GIM79161.1 hypothetical protein Aco04nite_64130 [Actinoplanes consettensis]